MRAGNNQEPEFATLNFNSGGRQSWMQEQREDRAGVV